MRCDDPLLAVNNSQNCAKTCELDEVVREFVLTQCHTGRVFVLSVRRAAHVCVIVALFSMNFGAGQLKLSLIHI